MSMRMLGKGIRITGLPDPLDLTFPASNLRNIMHLMTGGYCLIEQFRISIELAHIDNHAKTYPGGIRRSVAA